MNKSRSTFGKFLNIRTGQIATVVNKRYVDNSQILVYELDTGEIWNSDLFAEHWTPTELPKEE